MTLGEEIFFIVPFQFSSSQDDRHERYPTTQLTGKHSMKMEEELKTMKKTVEQLQKEKSEIKTKLHKAESKLDEVYSETAAIKQEKSEIKTKLHKAESKLDEVYSETAAIKQEFAKHMTDSVRKTKEMDCLKAQLKTLEELVKSLTAAATTSNISADAATHSLPSSPVAEQSSPSSPSPPVTTDSSLTPNKEKKKVPNSLHIELVSDSQSVTTQPEHTGRNNEAPTMHFVRTSRPPPSQPSQPSGHLHPHQPLPQRFPQPLPRQTQQVLPLPSSLLPSFPSSSFPPPSSPPPGPLHHPTPHHHPSQHPSVTFSEVLQTTPLKTQQDSRPASSSHNPSSSLQSPQNGRKKQLVRLYGVCFYDVSMMFL